MRIFISILITICFSQIALADTTYVCTSGNMERKIEVVYLGAVTVPCEVRYTKEGNTEVLWSAETEEGYCDFKASGFVEKHRSWGWECEEGMNAMSEPPAPESPEAQRTEEGMDATSEPPAPESPEAPPTEEGMDATSEPPSSESPEAPPTE
jgi:hypothetical protein